MKKASSTKRGSNKERAFAEILANSGWAVQRAPLVAKFINGRWIAIHSDFFGCFDGIGTRSDQEPLFYQVTTGTNNSGPRQAKIALFASTYLPLREAGLSHCRVLMAIWEHTKENGYHFIIRELGVDMVKRKSVRTDVLAWRDIGRLRLNGAYIKPPHVRAESDWNWSFRSLFDPPGDLPGPEPPKGAEKEAHANETETHAPACGLPDPSQRVLAEF